MKNNWDTSILIIEDDEIDAVLISERLNISGLYKIYLANNLQSALEQLSRNINLDAILLDLILPDSKATDTFNAIYKKAPHIPIIILTGVDDDAVVLHTLQNGAQDYLIKAHVNNQLLERTIRYAIERKQFEEDLIKSKTQLDEAMEVAQLYPWEFDVKENTFIFSEKLWEFFENQNSPTGFYRLSSQDYVEKYVYSKDRYIFEEEIKNALNTSDSLYSSQIEYRIVCLDGQIKHILSRIRVRIGENSQPVKFFGIIQDITERKIALQKSYETLNQVDSAKTEFLYFISQEIRTPLNGVVSAVNLIKNQENSTAVRALVETLDKAVSNLESFTNNTILYSKLTNNFKPELSEVNLKDIVQFALLEKEDILNEKAIRIKLEADNQDLIIKGDKELVYKLFINIIDVFACNSSKHGLICIELCHEGENVSCSICNPNHSFPEGLLNSYSLVSGIYQNCQMGLRLYLIKLIVDKHKGELTIFNKNDSWASAKFVFPK